MRTFGDFSQQVELLLSGTAGAKGYSATGPDGPNRLYEFVETMNDGPGHALGEIVYKARRYAAKRNPEDLLKAAAWCFLAWKYSEPGPR